MKKILKGALSVLLSAALTVPIFSMAAFAEEAPTVKIPVTITLTGSKPSTAETLTVVMTPEDAASPMPEGTVDGIYKLATIGAGNYEMAPMTFDKVGIHDYTIRQEAGSHKRGTYDARIYDMTVFVTNKETGGLETTVVMHLDGVEAKPGKVEFTNSYKSSGGGGGDSGGSPSGDGTSGSTSDGGPGVTIEDSAVPTATILPFDVPLALPQTGTLWWLVPILAIAGIVMFFGGMFKRRKNCEEDEI